MGRGARRRASDGVGRGVRGCCSSAWRARFRAGAPLWLRLHRGLCRRQLPEHAAAGVVPGGRHGGARGSLLCCGCC
ncbi:hypothetical protein KCP77_01940 [Salmonella enterica subsp. enterica]|nr:hypothetical protein KCP77_01940 [Salmonella enterica subsp. enterica]